MVQLLLQIGLHLNECSQLMLCDISVGERSRRVIVRSSKGNKARTVPLGLDSSGLSGSASGIFGENMSRPIYTQLYGTSYPGLCPF